MRGIVDTFLWQTIQDVLPDAGKKVCKQIYDELFCQPSWTIADIEALYY